ncbi:ankyrin repeat domain-containing protein [Paraburkholderia sp.]|uniref:ankyrin repeat domain-containing protein n=1 Tax=Paraburkholderia sp. TaxID=1926495 RepID=UPI003D6F567E
MLRKVSSRANPAIAKLGNDLFLLTTIVGNKQGPFRFDRSDYMKCCADAGPELKRTLAMHAPEFFGNTPLMNALFNDNEDFSVALILHHLSCGISLNEGDSQQKTPLMISAVKGQHDAFGLLLDHGANPGLQDQTGNNVLHLICMRGNVTAFEALKRSMSPEDFAALADRSNNEGYKPAQLLNPTLEPALFDDVSKDESGLDRYGKFDKEYSIWAGRPVTASCDMDSNVSRNADPRTLREALVADRRALAQLMST